MVGLTLILTLMPSPLEDFLNQDTQSWFRDIESRDTHALSETGEKPVIVVETNSFLSRAIEPQPGAAEIVDRGASTFTCSPLWKATVRIQLVDCVIGCNFVAYDLALDFTTDDSTLIPRENVRCTIHQYLWCCGDPDAESNQNCTPEFGACNSFIGDVTITPEVPVDPLYPPPCPPRERGFWGPFFQYYLNEWVNYLSDFYIVIQPPPGTDPEFPPPGTLPTDSTYWRQLIDEDPGDTGCGGRISYNGGMELTLSSFEGDWYLSFTFAMDGVICDAGVSGIYGLTLPINDNVGPNPEGSYHYESSLGGGGLGTIIADIDITSV